MPYRIQSKMLFPIPDFDGEHPLPWIKTEVFAYIPASHCSITELMLFHNRTSASAEIRRHSMEEYAEVAYDPRTIPGSNGDLSMDKNDPTVCQSCLRAAVEPGSERYGICHDCRYCLEMGTDLGLRGKYRLLEEEQDKRIAAWPKRSS